MQEVLITRLKFKDSKYHQHAGRHSKLVKLSLLIYARILWQE